MGALVARDVISSIGRTPLVQLRAFAPHNVRVFAKLELQNLYAMKDRVARSIILAARHAGHLSEGSPIIESSSGTMALAVGLVGTTLGHPVHIVTDPRIDRITLAKLKAMGCEVHIVSAMDGHGWQGARLAMLASLMAENPGAFWPRQYENPDNPSAYGALADELLAELGHLDVLVGSVGSGGSLCGSARALRRTLPDLRVVGVDCCGSVLFGQADRPTRLQSGLGNSLHPTNLDHTMIDEVHWLNDREAFQATRELAREEKIFAGNTSGSVYRVLTSVAARVPSGSTVVGIFPDRGDRYVDTVYSDDFWQASRLTELPLSGRPRQVLFGTEVLQWSYAQAGMRAASPRLLFIEANTTGTGMTALRSAAALGYEPVFFTSQPGRYRGLSETTATIVRCDTNDTTRLRAAVMASGDITTITGITTTSEYYLSTVAELAAELGLPGESADAVTTCRDKGRMRVALQGADVGQPRFRVAVNAAAGREAFAELGGPVVVKPVDESGSSRVRRCDTEREVEQQVTEIIAVTSNSRGQPAARRALVEDFLDAPEYSVEMFGVGGQHTLLAIVEKQVTGGPHFVEVRHVFPADLSNADAEHLTATVCRALTAVGLSRGASHTEVKLTRAGARIVEINPRPAGGMIPELIRLVTGTDLIENQLRCAAGMDSVFPKKLDGYAGIQFLTSPASGLLNGIYGVETAQAVDGVLDVTVTTAPAQHVAPPVDAYGRLGHIVAVGTSRTELVNALTTAQSFIKFAVRSGDAPS
jgi:S-sulfo-L-cysteine synthase (3-phospho-L-serine-dependent)